MLFSIYCRIVDPLSALYSGPWAGGTTSDSMVLVGFSLVFCCLGLYFLLWSFGGCQNTFLVLLELVLRGSIRVLGAQALRSYRSYGLWSSLLPVFPVGFVSLFGPLT